MIRLSKKSDYGIIALSYIAQSPGRVVSAKEVAQHCGGHNSVIANLLKEFAKAELLISVRGLHGGYKLARPATGITLKEILELLEGPLALVDCASPADPSGSLCSLTGICPSRRPMLVLHHRISRLFEETRLSDLCAAPMPAGTTLSLEEIRDAVAGGSRHASGLSVRNAAAPNEPALRASALHAGAAHSATLHEEHDEALHEGAAREGQT